jgi:putative endonuclease
METNNQGCYVYISTDKTRTMIETGVAGALNVRFHFLEYEKETSKALESNPDCIYLIYWERLPDIIQAIERERALRRLSKKKKIMLINNANPEWVFLNENLSEKKEASL